MSTKEFRRSIARAATVGDVEAIRDEWNVDPPEADDDRQLDGVDVEPPDCQQCGGPTTELGRLGERVHYRCRNCGGESSVHT